MYNHPTNPRYYPPHIHLHTTPSTNPRHHPLAHTQIYYTYLLIPLLAVFSIYLALCFRLRAARCRDPLFALVTCNAAVEYLLFHVTDSYAAHVTAALVTSYCCCHATTLATDAVTVVATMTLTRLLVAPVGYPAMVTGAALLTTRVVMGLALASGQLTDGPTGSGSGVGGAGDRGQGRGIKARRSSSTGSGPSSVAASAAVVGFVNGRRTSLPVLIEKVSHAP